MTAPFQSKLIPHEKEIFDLWYHQRATLKMMVLRRFVKKRG